VCGHVGDGEWVTLCGWQCVGYAMGVKLRGCRWVTLCKVYHDRRDRTGSVCLMSKVYHDPGIENLMTQVYLDPWGRCTWWVRCTIGGREREFGVSLSWPQRTRSLPGTNKLLLLAHAAGASILLLARGVFEVERDDLQSSDKRTF